MRPLIARDFLDVVKFTWIQLWLVGLIENEMVKFYFDWSNARWTESLLGCEGQPPQPPVGVIAVGAGHGPNQNRELETKRMLRMVLPQAT